MTLLNTFSATGDNKDAYLSPIATSQYGNVLWKTNKNLS